MNDLFSITFISGNLRKLEQIRQGLSSLDSCTLLHKSINLPELQGTPKDVARAKCIAATQYVQGPLLVEDTSLSIHSLGGLPGVYIKPFMEALGKKGLLELIQHKTDRTATAQTIFAYTEGPKSPVSLFIGSTDGVIVEFSDQKGRGWWDDIFQPLGYVQTFDKIPIEEKWNMGPRFKALKLLKSFLVEQIQRSSKLPK